MWWGELSSECGASCLLNGASCLLNVGRVVSGRVLFGASCLGTRCLWGELSVIPFFPAPKFLNMIAKNSNFVCNDHFHWLRHKLVSVTHEIYAQADCNCGKQVNVFINFQYRFLIGR